MKTNFSLEQLAQPQIAEAEKILKSCQHYGFCTSGCPTYVLLHDENDSPRGRIDLIKEMLESDEPPKASTVAHIDKCLSCMSCMTTCAVKVDYLHLVDVARFHIETHYRRPWVERWMRNTLAYVLPRPKLFAGALTLARMAAPARYLLPRRLQAAFDLVPENKSERASQPAFNVYGAVGQRRARVALLAGCVQPVIAPQINDATISLLTHLGCEVVVPSGTGCCGSLALHLGKTEAAKKFAKANVDAWLAEMNGAGLDAIIINASGCGSTVKDYPHLLADDSLLHARAEEVARIALDISEWLVKLGLPTPANSRRLAVTYHDACSLRNVQKVTSQPRALLKAAGYVVNDVPESHFCCGSAGTYNLLQPEIARDLGQRKAAHIASTKPQIVAAGNIGCLTQIAIYSDTPIVHTVELLNWAYGGATPPALIGVALEPLPDAAPAGAEVVGIEQTVFFAQKRQTETQSTDVGLW